MAVANPVQNPVLVVQVANPIPVVQVANPVPAVLVANPVPAVVEPTIKDFSDKVLMSKMQEYFEEETSCMKHLIDMSARLALVTKNKIEAQSEICRRLADLDIKEKEASLIVEAAKKSKELLKASS
jgi:hypothetical protein